MRALVEAIKFLLPNSVIKKIRPIGHGFLALCASFYYHHPADEMIVVGVTGTAGKSSTVQMLSKILNSSGMKTGFVTTVGFFDGDKDFINKHGLSMPGWFLLQKQLRMMVENGCKCAIVEATSEGLSLNRHLGINFDAALLTNLSPAHIDAHGGFENYRKAKGKLFQAVANAWVKKDGGKKFAVINFDDPNAHYFRNMGVKDVAGISFDSSKSGDGSIYLGENLVAENDIQFKLRGVNFHLGLIGTFNAYNALLAIAAADTLGVSLEESSRALSNFQVIPGRIEEISNLRGLKIYVDYAPEPAGMESVLKVLSAAHKGRLIHVFGSTGGHRDVRKRFEFGKIAAEYDDVIIVTNDDVYDSDPEKIAEDIISGISSSSKKKAGQEVLKVLDRREAIKKSLEVAKTGDTIIFTGKGSEQFLVLPADKRISWDEREVIREYLK